MKPVIALSLSLCLFSAAPAIAQDSWNETSTELRIYNATDWRSRDPDVPFSEPVIVHDDFDGDYLAVFDRNFQGSMDWNGRESGVISNWSRDYIRVYVYEARRTRCFLCSRVEETTAEAQMLEVKAGEQVFRIAGSNGNFPVSEEMRQALYSAPPGQALIRITLEESGAAIVNDIGEETVEAWRIVYAPQAPDPSALEQPATGN